VSRRLIIAGVAAAALGGAAVPAALASTGGPVTVDTSNGVSVGVHNGNTPIAGASVTPDGQACVGISLQLPVCTPGGIVGPIGTTAQQATDFPVTVDTSNGVSVGSHLGNQPLVGAHVGKDGACIGFSYEIPFCAGVSGNAQTRQALPVTVRHDDNGTAVGVGDVGVVIYPNGDGCPVVSTDNIRCIPTPAG